MRAARFQSIERSEVALPEGPARLISVGSGDTTVLFFPALGDAAAAYAEVMVSLGTSCRTVAVDPPGYGMLAPESPLPFSALRTWARALCEHVPGDKILVGNSVGGALAAAGAAAPHVRGLVLMGWPTTTQLLPTPCVLLPDNEEALLHLLKRTWATPPTLGPSARRILLESLSTPAFAAHAHSFEPAAFVEDLARWRGPLHFVAGCQDGLVPLAAMQDCAAAHPGSQLLELDACGHYPHREQPGTLSRWLHQLVASSALLETS